MNMLPDGGRKPRWDCPVFQGQGKVLQSREEGELSRTNEMLRAITQGSSKHCSQLEKVPRPPLGNKGDRTGGCSSGNRDTCASDGHAESNGH